MYVLVCFGHKSMWLWLASQLSISATGSERGQKRCQNEARTRPENSFGNPSALAAQQHFARCPWWLQAASVDCTHGPSFLPSFLLSFLPFLPFVPPLRPSLLPSFSPSLLSSFPPFLLPSFPPFLLPSFPPSLLSSFPPSFLPSFPPSFPPFLLPSFPPSLLSSFLPFVLPSFPPSLLPSLFPFFLPSFLPACLPAFLPSFPPFLLSSFPPFLLPSFLPSFPPSLLPSFPPFLLPSFPPSLLSSWSFFFFLMRLYFFWCFFFDAFLFFFDASPLRWTQMDSDLALVDFRQFSGPRACNRATRRAMSAQRSCPGIAVSCSLLVLSLCPWLLDVVQAFYTSKFCHIALNIFQSWESAMHLAPRLPSRMFRSLIVLLLDTCFLLEELPLHCPQWLHMQALHGLDRLCQFPPARKTCGQFCAQVNWSVTYPDIPHVYLICLFIHFISYVFIHFSADPFGSASEFWNTLGPVSSSLLKTGLPQS